MFIISLLYTPSCPNPFFFHQTHFAKPQPWLSPTLYLVLACMWQPSWLEKNTTCWWSHFKSMTTDLKWSHWCCLATIPYCPGPPTPPTCPSHCPRLSASSSSLQVHSPHPPSWLMFLLPTSLRMEATRKGLLQFASHNTYGHVQVCASVCVSASSSTRAPCPPAHHCRWTISDWSSACLNALL